VLFFQTILLASLTSVAPAVPAASVADITRLPAPIWATSLLSLRGSWKAKLQLSLPCSSAAGAAPCGSLLPERGLGQWLPATLNVQGFELKLRRRNDVFRTQGGFVHLDVVGSPSLRVGPEFSWSSPDSPREDLPKMRLLSPGWGVRFAWRTSPVAVGVSACSRFVMVGRDLPVVDPLTSEARVELRLP
jgi:hypothetical protein